MIDKSVISLLLKDRNNYDTVEDIINVQLFKDISLAKIFSCINHCYNIQDCSKIDFTSFKIAQEALNIKGITNKQLRELYDFPADSSNLNKFVGRLIKQRIIRDAELNLNESLIKVRKMTGEEKASEILERIEEPIIKLVDSVASTDNDTELMFDGIVDFVEHLVENPVDVIGVSTGYYRYDAAIGGGLRGGTVNLIGARPKQAKTMLTDNIGLYVSNSNIPVLNLDTEMKREDHWSRLIAMMNHVDISDVEKGKFDKRKILSSVSKLNKAYSYRQISGQPFNETLLSIKQWIKRKVGLNENNKANPCLVILDYLKLMDSGELTSSSMAEFQLLGFMITQLHNLCVKYDIPCLAFAQLNRDGIDREDTDVISQSDRLIWLCSNFSIWKDKPHNEIMESKHTDKRYNKKLIPISCRHGPGLSYGDFINYYMEKTQGWIIEGPRDKEHSGELPQTTETVSFNGNR